MASLDDFIGIARVPAGKRIRLKDFDPAWAGDANVPKKERKQAAKALLSDDVSALAESQQLLYAANSHAILIVLQALDAAGKDGTIKHVMSGVNPQGVMVHSFKHPSAVELDHDFLWRCAIALPERGQIGIFNRSYYEEVLIVKVHPELVEAERVPDGEHDKNFWKHRYEDINAFERHLTRNGTVVLKFFLHISKDEQRQRFLDRIDDPDKQWKFSPNDMAERAYWYDYTAAYEEAISATSTEWAPWYVIPANHKWVSRALVAGIITRSIQSLGLRYPEITPELAAQIAAAQQELEKS